MLLAAFECGGSMLSLPAALKPHQFYILEWFYFLKLIEGNKLGQTFITDTNTTKIPSILKDLKVDHKVFQISNGNLKM